MPLHLLRALSVLALLGTAAPALSQAVGFGAASDTDAPVEVAADSLQVNQSSGQATFTGNVVISQDEMRLSADEVTVDYAETGENRIRSLHATGTVTLVSGPDAAEAQDAVYDVESGTVALSGDVILTQGQNVLSGERANIDLNTGQANMSGRVRSVLQPGGN